MAAAYLCNHTPEKTWSGAYLALAKLLQSAGGITGIGSASLSLPHPGNTRCCSMSLHAEHLKACCSYPRYARPVVR